MPKLPIISGKNTVRRFEKIGYVIVRQKGSHIRMHHKTDKSKKPLSIPLHSTLGRGLLKRLIRDAEISVEEFLNLKD